MIWGSARQNKYFQRCIDRNDEDCKKFGNFISWIEITMNFERQKLGLTYDQYAESSNSNHSITTFLLIASYFLLHLCVINLLVQTLKSTRTHISRRYWKSIPTFVGNRVHYWLAMGHVLGMSTSTIMICEYILDLNGCKRVVMTLDIPKSLYFYFENINYNSI